MGRYINTVEGIPLPPIGKADAILQLVPDAYEISRPSTLPEDFVVVVENGLFDAAAYAADERDFLDFTEVRSDRRSRRYLIVPGAMRMAR